MGSRVVVPTEVIRQQQSKLVDAKRHDNSARALVLERQDESLYDCNRPMLPDGSKSRVDAAGPAPVFVLFTELWSLVGDNVLGLVANGLNDDIEPISSVAR